MTVAARGGFQHAEMLDVRLEWQPCLFICDAGD
jgi:hypothetical protein